MARQKGEERGHAELGEAPLLSAFATARASDSDNARSRPKSRIFCCSDSLVVGIIEKGWRSEAKRALFCARKKHKKRGSFGLVQEKIRACPADRLYIVQNGRGKSKL